MLVAGYYIILVSDGLISLRISAADINLIAVAHNLLLISLFALAVEAVSSSNAVFITYFCTNISYQNTSISSNTSYAGTYSSLSNISFFICKQINLIRIQLAVIYARYYRRINSIYTNSHACCTQTGTAGTGSKFGLQLIISFNRNILRRITCANSAVSNSSINCVIHIVDGDNTAYACADSSRNSSISSLTQNIRIIFSSNSNVSSITVMLNVTIVQRSLSFAAIIENCNRSANSSTAHSTCHHSRITEHLNLIDMVSIDSQAIVRAGNIFHLRCRLRRSLEHRGSACNANASIGAASCRNTNSIRQNIMLIERINRQLISINSIFRFAVANKLRRYVTVHNVAVTRFTYSNTCISRSCHSRRADMAVNFRIIVCTHIYISSIGNIASNSFIDIGCLNTSHSCSLNAVHSHSTGSCHSRSRGYSHTAGNNHVINFVCAIRINEQASLILILLVIFRIFSYSNAVILALCRNIRASNRRFCITADNIHSSRQTACSIALTGSNSQSTCIISDMLLTICQNAQRTICVNSCTGNRRQCIVLNIIHSNVACECAALTSCSRHANTNIDNINVRISLHLAALQIQRTAADRSLGIIIAVRNCHSSATGKVRRGESNNVSTSDSFARILRSNLQCGILLSIVLINIDAAHSSLYILMQNGGSSTALRRSTSLTCLHCCAHGNCQHFRFILGLNINRRSLSSFNLRISQLSKRILLIIITIANLVISNSTAQTGMACRNSNAATNSLQLSAVDRFDSYLINTSNSIAVASSLFANNCFGIVHALVNSNVTAQSSALLPSLHSNANCHSIDLTVVVCFHGKRRAFSRLFALQLTAINVSTGGIVQNVRSGRQASCHLALRHTNLTSYIDKTRFIFSFSFNSVSSNPAVLNSRSSIIVKLHYADRTGDISNALLSCAYSHASCSTNHQGIAFSVCVNSIGIDSRTFDIRCEIIANFLVDSSSTSRNLTLRACISNNRHCAGNDEVTLLIVSFESSYRPAIIALLLTVFILLFSAKLILIYAYVCLSSVDVGHSILAVNVKAIGSQIFKISSHSSNLAVKSLRINCVSIDSLALDSNIYIIIKLIISNGSLHTIAVLALDNTGTQHRANLHQITLRIGL